MSGRILLVDDDHKVLEILEKSLSGKGHRVFVAQDGEAALLHYKDKRPDMVVLDINLPDMDGRDVLKIMRSVPKLDRVPVLFLSASSDPELKVSALNSGAEDFLVKPFSLSEFNAKVKKVLGTYRNQQALQANRAKLESQVSKSRRDLVEINKELKRQLLSMRTLFNISQDLNRRLDTEEMISGFALTLMGQMRISSVAVYALRRERDQYFHLECLKGFDRRRIADLHLATTGDFAKWLATQSGPQKILRLQGDSIVGLLPDMRLAIFEYVTPIIVKQNLRGVVLTGPRLSGEAYTPYEIEMLHSACNSAGIGMDNARLFRELQSTYLSTVKALVSIIEAKDSYTKGHTERVADYSVGIAAKMRLSKTRVREIAFGAVLHDIGKLLVYERVLNKPGNLTEEEWEMLKQHPEAGAEIIENMEFLAGTVPLVRHHHERYDGSGYPDGLRADQIPLGARIIAVADAFDAMTTDRPYRAALEFPTAIRVLRTKAGSQFDPEVVNAFIELVEIDGFRPRQHSPFEKLKPTAAKS
jgi:response regulator RpfG family c-di-GMP phosphodiesterase